MRRNRRKRRIQELATEKRNEKGKGETYVRENEELAKTETLQKP